MSICKNCGAENSSNSKFCTNCGTVFEQQTTTTSAAAQAPWTTQPQAEPIAAAPAMAHNPGTKTKKKLSGVWIAVIVILCIMFGCCILSIIFGLFNNDDVGTSSNDTTIISTKESITEQNAEVETTPVTVLETTLATTAETTIAVASEYELTAGYYEAGIDIPSGKCDVTAISGQGNLSSSNMFSGGLNEIFGIDDGTGLYNESFNGLDLPEGTVLSLSSNLKIKLIYTKIEGGYSGRTYDEANKITLTSGNYDAGDAFPAGVYTIVAVSGQGNLSSSNIFSGGVNEIFGIDDGTGLYNPEIKNVTLDEGVTLTLSSGLIVELIPSV